MPQRSISRMLLVMSNIYRSQQTRHAIKTGIAAIVAVLIYQYLNLPNGYWAVITAVIIMQSNMDSGSLEITLKLALQRLIGTVSGALSGFGVLMLLQPNFWKLLIIVFILIVLGSLLTRLYQGFNLSGLTATIIVLLSHQKPITQSIALIRSTEILLGVIIAIVITIVIWPYRISDHLRKSRKKRLLLLYKQFSELLGVCKNQPLPSSWSDEQKKLISQTKNEQEYVNAATNELKSKAQSTLDLELSLVKYVSRLGEVLPYLPTDFWKFTRLKSDSVLLMDTLNNAIKMLAEDTTSEELSLSITRKTQQFLTSFEGFRLSYRQLKTSSFKMEQIYQIFTSIQAIQKCSETIKILLNTV